MGLSVYVLAVKIEENLFSSLELVVGLMLVFLAITTILNKKITILHKHPHQHKDGTTLFTMATMIQITSMSTNHT
jgi:hypothetical protein